MPPTAIDIGRLCAQRPSNKGKTPEAPTAPDKDGGTATTPGAVKIVGAIATATGACPIRTVTVGTKTFVTDSATAFEDGLCADLVAPAAVKVKVVTTADGRLLATSVDFDAVGDTDEPEDDEDDSEGGHHGEGPHDGTVSSFRGACPAVTFNLRGLTIVADATTKYVGGTCDTLRPSVKVLVTGTLLPEWRRFKAETITISSAH